MRSIDMEILDLADEIFRNDEDLIEASSQFMRGFLTAEGFKERAQFLKIECLKMATRRLVGPMRPDDSQALPGTWDESESA